MDTKYNHDSKPVAIGLVLFLAATLFVVVNIASNSFLKSMRLDLTYDKVYTLSKGTKQILSELKEPIVFKFYFSKKLVNNNPYLASFAFRVKELLEEYQQLSDGNITLQVLDPQPFTELEDEAVNYGLQGVPVDNEGNEFYFGLVATNSTVGKEVIPFFQLNRESHIEYDISRLIYKLAVNKLPKIGVISSLNMQGSQNPMSPQQTKPWAIWQQMSEQFDVMPIKQDIVELPKDLNLLMLVNPQELTEKSAYAIDQYVMAGGKILAFVDPKLELKQGSSDKEFNSDLNRLLLSWGIELDTKNLVAARDVAKKVRYESEDSGKEQVSLYPLWMDIPEKNLESSDLIMDKLPQLTFASAGSLSPAPNASNRFKPLVKTSTDATLFSIDKVDDYQKNPTKMMQDYKPSNKQYVLAARVTGPVYSAFTPEDKSQHLSSNAQSNIIVVADADFLHDHFWISMQEFLGTQFGIPSSGNGNFILSAIENLSGSNALISIRNRSNFVRYFDKIRELEINSQQIYKDSEKALLDKLEDIKQKLSSLESNKDMSNLLISQERKREENDFRQEIVETRKALRNVRHELNRDIERLENNVKFIAIGFIPLLITLGGLFYWVMKTVDSSRSRRESIN